MSSVLSETKLPTGFEQKKARDIPTKEVVCRTSTETDIAGLRHVSDFFYRRFA